MNHLHFDSAQDPAWRYVVEKQQLQSFWSTYGSWLNLLEENINTRISWGTTVLQRDKFLSEIALANVLLSIFLLEIANYDVHRLATKIHIPEEVRNSPLLTMYFLAKEFLELDKMLYSHLDENDITRIQTLTGSYYRAALATI